MLQKWKTGKNKYMSIFTFDIAFVSALMMCGMARTQEGPELKTFKFGEKG
jgi:hypothetical protein